ncbi:MAG: transporter [Desulfuromonas sp.]|nr:transporter [Desulfuromonas sp.]
MLEKKSDRSLNFTFRCGVFIAAVLSVVAISFTPALATEGGGGTYPNGAESIMAGALPPQGLYFLNYSTYYTADRLNDEDGDKIPVDFDLDVVANVSRFVYMTKYKLLGADFGMYVTIPLVYMDVSLETPVVNMDDSDGYLGDIAFSPFLLAWHSKNLHVVAALDITTPTGEYDEDNLANVGRNYWTIQPIVAATFLSDQGFELSAKVMYDFNTENRDTDYTSGQEFHFDYGAAYHMAPWAFGVGGYYYKQMTDDHGGNGMAKALDGFRGQVFAVGPTVKYDYKNMSFEAKYQKEFLVENRPEGDKFWLKVIWPF